MNQEKPTTIQISKPGEVYNEFEALRRKHIEDLRQLREKEALKNEECAKQLQEEEEKKLAERQRREMEDLKVAQEIARKLQEDTALDAASSHRHPPDSSFMPGGFAVSTPIQASLKPSKKGFLSNSRRGLLRDTSTVLSYGDKTTAVIGPLDSFIRPKSKNASNSDQNQSSVSTLSETSTTKETKDYRRYWKIAYTPPNGYFDSSSSKYSEEDNRFRPIKPSPLTPTKNSPAKQVIAPQTMKPSSSRSLFCKTASNSSPLKPIPSNAPFSSGRCAFAPTSVANRGMVSEDASDSETDFEDSLDEIVNSPVAVLTLPKPFENTTSSKVEMKELEDYVIRSYSNQTKEADLPLVNFNKKSINQLQLQSNRLSLSPGSKERNKQILADYELALQLQEKENLALKQPIESSYELRKRPPASSFSAGNSSKKQRLDKKSGFKTKQKTIEEAFQLKSS